MMKSKRITATDVGAWLLKGNPNERWDYWGKRRDEGWPVGVNDKRDWSLGETYRNRMIQDGVGDKVILYMTGATQAVVEIGLRDERPLFPEEWDPKYVIDRKELHRRKLMVSYDGVLLPTPIPKAAIKAHPALANAELFRAPMMTNPTYLTHDEVKALELLIDPQILGEAGW